MDNEEEDVMDKEEEDTEDWDTADSGDWGVWTELIHQENENTPSDTSDWDENIQNYLEGLQREPPEVSPVRESVPEVPRINQLPDESGYKA